MIPRSSGMGSGVVLAVRMEAKWTTQLRPRHRRQLQFTLPGSCRLLEDRSGVVVQGLEEVIVRSAAEIYQVLARGSHIAIPEQL
jgi:hypothetical protein